MSAPEPIPNAATDGSPNLTLVPSDADPGPTPPADDDPDFGEEPDSLPLPPETDDNPLTRAYRFQLACQGREVPDPLPGESTDAYIARLDLWARRVSPDLEPVLERLDEIQARLAQRPLERTNGGPAGENACAPLRERDTAQAFDPPLLAAFAAAHTATVEWEVPGYLGRGVATVLAGLPKVGKTTRVADWVGGIAARTPVLWIDLEQPRGLTAKVLTTHCATDARVYVCWGALPDLVQAATWCREHEVGVVVVDSLSKVWRAFGVEDENDPVQVEQALRPLLTFARTAQVALLVLHHLRKSGGDEGLDFRGSGQIMAAFDIAVSFRRFTTNAEVEDPRRVLHSLSRFEETPRQLVIEYVDHHYIACGTPGEVRRRKERDDLLTVLTAEPQTAEDLATASKLAASAARTVLRALTEQHVVERTGAGRKGDPFRYSKCLRAEESLYLRTSISSTTGEQERTPGHGDAYEPKETP